MGADTEAFLQTDDDSISSISSSDDAETGANSDNDHGNYD